MARVEETWQQFVPTAQLQRAEPRDFRFDWTSVTLPGLSVVRYELAAGVTSTVAPTGQLLACRVSGAGARAGTAEKALVPDTAWITGGDAVTAHWDGPATVQALIFDHDEAQRAARQISGDDRLELAVHDAAARDAGSGELWSRTFDYLLGTLSSCAMSDGLLLAAVQRHALNITLTAFPTTFHDTMERSPQTRAAPASVRRALEFIDANAHLPVTVDDVAVAVNMSTRGLQRAFQRALGTAPGDALRRARLAGAHRELIETTDPVAEIARRWGFSHPSRFAAYFRAEYGLLPGTIARRHR
ncbi:AraC family transcriptional regulator [Microbacterium sp. GXF0217]